MELKCLTKEMQGAEVYVRRLGNARVKGRPPYFRAVIERVSRVNSILLFKGERLRVRTDGGYDDANHGYAFYESLDHLRSQLLCDPIVERLRSLSSNRNVGAGEQIEPSVLLQVAKLLGVDVDVDAKVEDLPAGVP